MTREFIIGKLIQSHATSLTNASNFLKFVDQPGQDNYNQSEMELISCAWKEIINTVEKRIEFESEYIVYESMRQGRSKSSKDAYKYALVRLTALYQKYVNAALQIQEIFKCHEQIVALEVLIELPLCPIEHQQYLPDLDHVLNMQHDSRIYDPVLTVVILREQRVSYFDIRGYHVDELNGYQMFKLPTSNVDRVYIVNKISQVVESSRQLPRLSAVDAKINGNPRASLFHRTYLETYQIGVRVIDTYTNTSVWKKSIRLTGSIVVRAGFHITNVAEFICDMAEKRMRQERLLPDRYMLSVMDAELSNGRYTSILLHVVHRELL